MEENMGKKFHCKEQQSKLTEVVYMLRNKVPWADAVVSTLPPLLKTKPVLRLTK